MQHPISVFSAAIKCQNSGIFPFALYAAGIHHIIIWRKMEEKFHSSTHFPKNMFPIQEVRTYCKNCAVNAILSFYAEKAEKNGISMQVTIQMADPPVMLNPRV